MLLALLIDEITKVRAQSTLRAMGHCWLLPCPRSRTLGVHLQVRGKKKLGSWNLQLNLNCRKHKACYLVWVNVRIDVLGLWGV